MSFENIIAKVKKHPVIWKWSCSTNNKRVVLARVWAEIAKELRIDEKLARKRWKHLKDQYRKEVRKMLESNIQDIRYCEPTWAYFQQMSFIRDEINVPDNRGPENSDKDEDTNTKKSESESQSDSEADEPVIKKVKKTECIDRKDSPVSNKSDIPKIVETVSSSQDKRIGQILKRLRTMTSMIDSRQSNEALFHDPDYMFLMSILPLMKNLSELQKLHFRGKVNDLLMEAYMQNECDNPIADNMVYIDTKLGLEKED